MLENINQRLLMMVSAPPDLSGGALLLSMVIAEWAIFLGPTMLVLLWIFGDQEDRRAAVGACLSAFVGLPIAGGLSSLIFHPRPFMNGSVHNYLHHAVDSSFPSDHATLLFALGFSMVLVPPRSLPRVWIFLLVVSCAVGWSRVYLGAHFPFDIVAAAIIGLGSALVLASVPGRRVRDAVTAIGEKLYPLPLSPIRFRRP